LRIDWTHDAVRQGPSWSSINYDGSWKLLHHRAKQFFSPVLVSATVDRAEGSVTVFVTSDVPAAIQGDPLAEFG
jgi:beta-mannosidase